jgi:hypothetical protein
MKLKQGERSIIAGFRRMDEAEKARNELKQLGLEAIRIDRVSLFPVRQFEKRNENAITGDFPGLANGIFDTAMDQDSSILASVQPSASGLSDGNDEEIGRDVVLTVVTNEKLYSQAAEIIQRHDGVF